MHSSLFQLISSNQFLQEERPHPNKLHSSLLRSLKREINENSSITEAILLRPYLESGQ